MTRRQTLAALGALAAPLARAAAKLPANRNVRWGLGTNLWNSFPGTSFTDILDVMHDTGFIGMRVTQFPQILQKYGMTQAQLDREVSKRGLHVVTISFNGPFQDVARREELLSSARKAMEFLKSFGADRLVVFSPNRNVGTGDAVFQTVCEGFNQVGALANSMGFRAGLHNHMGQVVQNGDELDRCMSLTDPKLFGLAPDTAHLYLAGIDPVKALDKYRDRLIIADYKDARHVSDKLLDNIFDLGDGEIDFPGCHRVLKSVKYNGWIIVDLDVARQGPRKSYERCGAYVVDKLEPIYV